METRVRLWFKDEKFSLREYKIHRAVMPGLVPGRVLETVPPHRSL